MERMNRLFKVDRAFKQLIDAVWQRLVIVPERETTD